MHQILPRRPSSKRSNTRMLPKEAESHKQKERMREVYYKRGQMIKDPLQGC